MVHGGHGRRLQFIAALVPRLIRRFCRPCGSSPSETRTVPNGIYWPDVARPLGHSAPGAPCEAAERRRSAGLASLCLLRSKTFSSRGVESSKRLGEKLARLRI